MLRYCIPVLMLLGGSLPAWSAGERVDYDVNKNGLIEIYDWADLNEVRHDPTGRTLYGSAAGCPEAGCRGIELMADLDFDTNNDGVIDAADTYWNDGKGWEPIGTIDDRFRGFFEGNGYVIRNLYVDRPEESELGLFGHISDTVVRRTGFAGRLTYMRGGHFSGMLAGRIHRTKIEAVYVTGRVLGPSTGGLVGYMWDDWSSIQTVFSTAEVSQDGTFEPWTLGGGVVGNMTGGIIRNSFSLFPLAAHGVGGSVLSSHDVLQGIEPPNNPRSLTELACATVAEDPACRMWLYQGWDDAKDTDGTPFWDYGNRFQLPGLVLNGRIFRDSDGDGLLDEDDDDIDGDGVDNVIDAFPDNPAASIDDNGNGLPDAWNSGCDSDCRAASGFVLDTADSNTDGNPASSAGAGSWLFLLFSGMLGLAVYRQNYRQLRR